MPSASGSTTSVGAAVDPKEPLVAELYEHERIGTKRAERAKRTKPAPAYGRIERGYPIPEDYDPKNPRPSKYPFAEMEVGESFTWPVADRRRLSTAAYDQRRRYGREFTIRKRREGGEDAQNAQEVLRVWRVR